MMQSSSKGIPSEFLPEVLAQHTKSEWFPEYSSALLHNLSLLEELDHLYLATDMCCQHLCPGIQPYRGRSTHGVLFLYLSVGHLHPGPWGKVLLEVRLPKQSIQKGASMRWRYFLPCPGSFSGVLLFPF